MGKMPWFGVAIDGLDDANSTRKYFPIDFCTDTKPVFYPINFCTEHYSWDEGAVTDIFWSIAIVSENMGDNEKALKNFKEAHRIFKANFGDGHENTLYLKEQASRVTARPQCCIII